MLQQVEAQVPSSLQVLRRVRKRHPVSATLVPIVISAALLSLMFASLHSVKLIAVSLIIRDGGLSGQNPVPEDVARALLHFATMSKVPQQSKKEIGAVMEALLWRAPCNFLVFGMWHDSLLWATFNHGGRTVFLDESQEWIDRMGERHPQLETYKVDYSTSLGDSDSLLEIARDRGREECRPHQPIQASDCPLALSRELPQELLTVPWDVILIDGPRSYRNSSFPGRMSPIFTSSVMARTRTVPGHTDIFLHDISRPSEFAYGMEFLCVRNLVEAVGDLWHFQIHSSTSEEFCS